MTHNLATVSVDGETRKLAVARLALPEAVGGGGEPDYDQRYRYLLNCFPQLVELWHGSLTIETPVHKSGSFRLANQYWEEGNTQRLSAWSDLLGYGWQLGDWCAAGTVESSLTDEGGKPFQGARFSKIMRLQTAHPARNPRDWFDFEVAVEDGPYRTPAGLRNSVLERIR